ncbi:MAG TPA: peptidase S41 [Phycisphaeraceae bacterium]|nr:peptidase S41 [Phycisphaeraceae bacterium]
MNITLRNLFTLVLISLTAMVTFARAADDDKGNVGFPRYPSLSPDGETLVFSWAGDLWKVPVAGGEAVRLTVHPGTDLQSAFSPDGKWLAFISKRAGYQNVYIADPACRNIRRLTFNDRYAYLRGFTADSKRVIFDSHLAHQIPSQRQMYTVPAEGGVRTRLLDCLGRSASESADGRQIVFVRGYSAWTRRGYHGSGARNIWRFDKESGNYSKVTNRDGNDGQPHFLPDGSIVFLSDRDGIVNVYRLPPDADALARPKQLTWFETDDVRDLSVSADGSKAVFVVWDRIYTLDLTVDKAAPQRVIVHTAGDLTSMEDFTLDLSSKVSEVALSPDGKTYALVAHGEVFVQAVEGDRPTRRVTDTPWRERDIAWSPDGSELYFVSDRSGSNSIYAASVILDEKDLQPEEEKPQKSEADEESAETASEESEAIDSTDNDKSETAEKSADSQEEKEKETEEEQPPAPRRKQWDQALRFTTRVVLDEPFEDSRPAPSPDGKSLAFVRGNGDLIILDLDSNEQRTLLQYWNLDTYTWSADSSMIAFARDDSDNNSDVWIVPADGSHDPVNISMSPDNDYQPAFSADGKILVFTSDRENKDDFDVYAVYLDKTLEGLPRYQLEDYYKEAAQAAGKRKPLSPDDETDDETAENDGENAEAAEQQSLFSTLSLDDAYLRLRRLTSIPGAEMNIALTPGGDRVVFTATVDGNPGLFSVKWDGSERKKLDSGPGAGNVSLSLTGDKVVYVRAGKARTVAPAGGKAETAKFAANISVNVEEQQRQKFLEASRMLALRFYDPNMKGTDWTGLTRKYLDLAVATRTIDGFNLVGNMLLGELNASHLGLYGPNPENKWKQPVGYLGAEYQPTPNGYRITGIYSNGPLDLGENGPRVGDILVEVDGVKVPADAVLDKAMLGKVGQQVLLGLHSPDTEPGEIHYVLADPIGYWDEDALAYADEVRRRDEKVEEMTGGRLGYLHIERMDVGSLKRFERDLYAVAHGKEGLVIDVRSNGGGWINDILLTSLMVQPHAYTINRGDKDAGTTSYPQDRRLIYAYTRPITVLCNQESFSNAEIFSHAIKTLKRGTLVGMTTYGGVISTGATNLIDGARLRLPLRGWYLPDGTDMELHGAEPDIIVEMTPADEAAGRDPQLEAAVNELLQRIDADN